jgi:ribonuclease HII
MNNSNIIIGIDEVGRGPLAGPVGVGVAVVPVSFDWALLPGVTDSKQLTEAKREAIAAEARRLQAAGQLDFAVSLVSAPVIDQIGIVPAINRAMDRTLKRLEQLRKDRQNTPVNRSILPATCSVKLDGGLRAPARYSQQETIIKGDSKEQVIGLASIVAKVHRDRYMQQVGKQPEFSVYDFAQHKGYGTKAHRAAIQNHGLSIQHRQSFCRQLRVP